MTSKLATRLLGLEHTQGECSDLLWKFANLTDVEISRTPITEALASELALFLDGEPARKFASLLPSLHVLRSVLVSKPTASIRTGAAQNPHVDDGTLDELVASGGKAAQVAAPRLERRKALDAALATGVTEDIAFAYEALSLDTDAHAIAFRLTHHKDSLLPLLGSDRRYPYRGLVIGSLDTSERDEICSDLIGALDQVYAATLVDETLAMWLSESDSTRAAASREQITSDRNSAKRFASRLTDAGMYPVLSHGELGTAIRSIITRRPLPVSSGQAHPLDRSMLSTLRVAGLGPDEISALIFSSKIELDAEELVRELEGVEPHRVSMFLGGQTVRHPLAGETNAILAARDLNQQEEIAKALGEDVKDLPWFPELLVGIPRSFVPVDDHRSSRIMDSFLSHELGSNAKAWEVVLAMSGEWEGSLRSLTNAARNL